MSVPGSTGEPARELRLIVQLGAEPIAGSLGCAGGPQHPFSGWLDLAAAIDAFTRATGAGDGEAQAVDPV